MPVLQNIAGGFSETAHAFLETVVRHGIAGSSLHRQKFCLRQQQRPLHGFFKGLFIASLHQPAGLAIFQKLQRSSGAVRTD